MITNHTLCYKTRFTRALSSITNAFLIATLASFFLSMFVSTAFCIPTVIFAVISIISGVVGHKIEERHYQGIVTAEELRIFGRKIT